MLSKLLIAAVCAGCASASSPEPVAVNRDAIVSKVNSLTSAVTESASKLERHERASVTRERMAQWTNFIADVEEHIPELLQDTATVAGSSAQIYEPLDFPAFVAAAPPATATWNPFEPWLVQLKAYRTYMANYIDYQLTWVYKLKCTFTGDCTVSTTMGYAAAGATKIVLGSVAGMASGDALQIPGTTSSSFLESGAATSASGCYTITAISGNTVTISPGLSSAMAEGTAVTKTPSCASASPSPSPSL